MRNHSGLWLLLCLSLAGCTASRNRATVVSRPTPTIARAESAHLSDLGKAARDKPSEHGKPSKKHRDNKRCGASSCSQCNSSPCTCPSSDNGLGAAIGSVLGPPIIAVVGAPFWLPVTLVADDYDISSAFPDYPYVDDLPGSLVKTTSYDGSTKGWQGTLQGFGMTETENIDRYGGRLVLESAARLGIDTETNYWREPGASGSDQLWTGDANLVFRFAESEKLQFRAGLGVNWLADHAGAEAGFNFTYGLDWFPRRPWTMSTVFDLGKLGGGTLFHNRTTAGVMLGPVEAFAGYDYFQIGSANFHGPVAGLGLRF